MSLPTCYYALYVQICRNDNVPVGSGICVDGRHIITCAHVVNAALQAPLTNTPKPAATIQVVFPQHTQLANQYYRALPVAWGWEALSRLTAHTSVPVDQLMKNDFAILALQVDEAIERVLVPESKKLLWLKGDLSGALLEAMAFTPDQPAIIGYITGSLGIEDRATGTSVMLPDHNPKSFFFEAGSSGSPVWATIRLEDGSILSGLAGFADFLNRKDRNSPYDARMVNTANIERLWASYQSVKKWRITDADQRRIQLKRNMLAGKIISERGVTGKEILCNRQEQIDAITQRKLVTPHQAKLFFLHGSERQKLDAFVDRYRYEYMATSGLESRHVFLKMPKEREISLFANKLVGNFCRANHQYQIPPLNIPESTLPQVMDKLLCDTTPAYVIDFKMENEDFSPLQLPLITWFLQDFLQPIHDGTEELYDVHVFISYYYTLTDHYQPNLQQLLRLFGNLAVPELENVPRHIVEEWLDLVEGADLERKNSIRRTYPLKADYDMAEIIEYYKKAIFNLDKF